MHQDKMVAVQNDILQKCNKTLKLLINVDKPILKVAFLKRILNYNEYMDQSVKNDIYHQTIE